MPHKHEVHLNTDKTGTTEHVVEFVDFGAEVIWTNHSTHCPHFEIIFEGSSPAKAGDKLTGTLNSPYPFVCLRRRRNLNIKFVTKKRMALIA